MNIVLWIVMGLLAGVLAKFLMPGKDPGGLVITILLGIAGAFVGGYISTHLGFGDLTGFSLGTLVVATGGAILILFVYRLVAKKT